MPYFWISYNNTLILTWHKHSATSKKSPEMMVTYAVFVMFNIIVACRTTGAGHVKFAGR